MNNLSPEIDTSRYPEQIAIIGGGRWAKVIISVLDGITPLRTKLSLHSRHCFETNQSWIANNSFIRSSELVRNYREFPCNISCVAIIANAAGDHQSAAESCLSAGFSTLIEKPFTMSGTGTQDLINLSKKIGIKLAAAHVFCYSPCIVRFGNLVRQMDSIQSVRVEWTDPFNEQRHGHVKHYDSSLPLFLDILPHIVSIFSIIFPIFRLKFEGLTFEKGGALVNLLFRLGSIPCTVLLSRNAKSRLRGIEVTQPEESLKLDFAREPGSIFRSDQLLVDDVRVQMRPGSLARMLHSFLYYDSYGEIDQRLKPTLALGANTLIDTIYPFYSNAQFAWLECYFSKYSSSADSDILYFLTEFLEAHQQISHAELEDLHQHLKFHFKNNTSTIENSLKNNNFRNLVRSKFRDLSNV